jgi:hypothetical protein
MKKIFTLISLGLISVSTFAQVGAVAPNFTQKDLNGTSHDLYTYLNAGKVVIVDMSATWCGPCWNFHAAHYLKDLYTEFGPTGTNQVVILFYEDDVATTLADLNGTTSGTQGNWVTGVPYPIINATASLPTQYGSGYPTVSVICPKDKKIMDNLAALSSLSAMRTSVKNIISSCSATSVGRSNVINLQDATIAPNPTAEITTLNFSIENDVTAKVSLYSAIGQLISVTTQQVVSGQNSIELNLAGLNAGTYFVKVSTKDAMSKMIPVLKYSSSR